MLVKIKGFVMVDWFSLDLSLCMIEGFKSNSKTVYSSILNIFFKIFKYSLSDIIFLVLFSLKIVEVSSSPDKVTLLVSNNIDTNLFCLNLDLGENSIKKCILH